MDSVVDQLVLGRFLADLGNLLDSVELLREGPCEVKQNDDALGTSTKSLKTQFSLDSVF